jgi:type IV pilus assembly protein PilN
MRFGAEELRLMARINLLPWRAELRKQQQKEFLLAIFLAILLTLGILFFVHSHVASLIDYQNRRNEFLQSEISMLDQKIAEIQELETKKKRLLAKMEVIQQLQSSRPEIVHLFDELARTMPDGVHLTDLTQSDKSLTVNGIAQSNARVSAYMRNLESSPWLREPLLNIIESKSENREARKDRGSTFTLQVRQSSDKPEDKKKGAS